MNLTLIRTESSSFGVYGKLLDESQNQIAVTLERLFKGEPKLPQGEYSCHRGLHRLKSLSHLFETFEVIDVPGCSGILFHVGNYYFDSEGCILLGKELSWANLGRNQGPMITRSEITFRNFMSLQEKVLSFKLIVRNKNGSASEV